METFTDLCMSDALCILYRLQSLIHSGFVCEEGRIVYLLLYCLLGPLLARHRNCSFTTNKI